MKIQYNLEKKDYRSNTDCRITAIDTDNDEVVFSGQFYADLDGLEYEDIDKVKKDLEKLKKYCNENDKDGIHYMMSNIFSWNCIEFDYIYLSN